MSAFRNLILFIILSVIALIIFAWYSGVFSKAAVRVEFMEPFVAAYQDEIGEYSETREVQDSLYNLLWEDAIENYKTFGIFYDDPRTTDIKKMHSRVGCIVEKSYIQKIEKLASKYKIFRFERQQCALVEISFKNTFSIYAGIYKAYPLLKEFAEENGYQHEPIIEIHDIPKKILFFMPLVKK